VKTPAASASRTAAGWSG